MDLYLKILLVFCLFSVVISIFNIASLVQLYPLGSEVYFTSPELHSLSPGLCSQLLMFVEEFQQSS